MKRLSYFPTFEANKSDEEIEKEETYPPKQNDFGGISPGSISLFEEDVIPSGGGMNSIEGYNFTMCTTMIGLWTLEGRNCHLIGLRSPFGRPDYVEYLNSLDEHAIAMLRERMEYYSMPEEASLLFGINNTIRVLQARLDDPTNPLYYIVYPDGSYEMTTGFNTTLRGEESVQRIQKYIGRNIYEWLKKKFIGITNQE